MGFREILNKIPFAWCMIHFPTFFVDLYFQSLNEKLVRNKILILFDIDKHRSSIGLERQKL